MNQQQDNPKSRREVWLSVALAVARDGMPEPCSLNLYADVARISIDAGTLADFSRWATHLGVKVQDRLRSGDGQRWIYRASGPLADGWHWGVNVSVPVGDPEPSPELAAQVVSAILDPDADLTAVTA
jgi:hypothetical protein